MFIGTYTAIITPFTADGRIDYDCLKALVTAQVAGGVEGIVPAGTTGESPTLDTREHIKVIETVVQAAAGKAKVLAGTGANSTAEAIELTQEAKTLGVDGTLQVTPYYNKPSQEGLYRHFSAVADLGLPVVLYNVPGRTGREIALETIARLSRHPSVVSVKEAAGDANRVSAIHALCDIDILCGDDSLTLPMIATGAVGVISVVSNIAPRAVSDMTRLALAGDFAKARALHKKYYPLFRDLFIDTNPVPVKYAAARLGLCQEIYRLPLCELSAAHKATLDKTLAEVGLL